ncbi:uncharacterized protein LOC100824279 [Brachypodium distachyon]|uniref:uncharacterized protein LOC100824279 n=1 Tax=Brachypodium distachyon TaxID=15368 RepID=UPI000D0DD88A|nr:uncharacterized protein LOC100824279 [Brachypodium distachyon]|eukprot:XP_024314530.1 uncharacterized protein LOC100824279 [Brachypodium distachyon]
MLVQPEEPIRLSSSDKKLSREVYILQRVQKNYPLPSISDTVSLLFLPQPCEDHAFSPISHREETETRERLGFQQVAAPLPPVRPLPASALVLLQHNNSTPPHPEPRFLWTVCRRRGNIPVRRSSLFLLPVSRSEEDSNRIPDQQATPFCAAHGRPNLFLRIAIAFYSKKNIHGSELKNATTGLGWLDDRQTVDCSKEWWDEHIERCNNAEKGIKCNDMKFRKHGVKHLDDLHIMFAKIHVTGSSAGCPGDVSSANDSDEDVIVVQQTNDSPEIKLAPLKKPKTSKKRKESSNASEEKDEKNPFYRSYKSTCGRIGAAADNISSSVQASSAPHPTSHVPSIADVMQMVKDCGVQVGTALMHTATMLIMKPDFREIFSKLQTKEGRLIC